MATFREFRRQMNYSLDQYLTPAVKWLILANLAVFLVITFLIKPLGLDEWFMSTFAQNAIFEYTAVGGSIEYRFNPFFAMQFFTYMFIHDTFWHILMNMLVLWFFGPPLEMKLGTSCFLKFYIFAGFLAGLVHGVMAPFLPSIARSYWMFGASGAVFGVLLAFALYYPNQTVLFMFLFPMPAWLAAAIFGFLAFSSLVSETRIGQHGLSQVSHLTHLAGFGFGYLWVALRDRMPDAWLFNNDPAPFRGGRKGGYGGRYSDL